ncbi:MAG: hypothetical protein KJO08_03325 [Gammaproteobacteria bacterium]|nr:hypothetical protein [Gammaproteobacteria bacterium]NNJ84367.1 hypothetical protein [Gammaproteobacteria bacterium]
MSATHLRGNDPLTPLLMGAQPTFRAPKRSHTHIEGFNNLVKYLVRLWRDGTLDDDDFGELVKMVSAVFIEAEISNRVENILDGAVDKQLFSIEKQLSKSYGELR